MVILILIIVGLLTSDFVWAVLNVLLCELCLAIVIVPLLFCLAGCIFSGLVFLAIKVTFQLIAIVVSTSFASFEKTM